MKYSNPKFTLEDVLNGSISLDEAILVNRGEVIEKIGICYRDSGVESRLSEYIYKENESEANKVLALLDNLKKDEKQDQ